MKGLFKLTTAALALFTFASCSTDDLFSNGADQEQNKEGILVEVEPLVDANTSLTRAAYTPSTTDSKGALSFTTGDDIKVTDATMLKYDIYSFNGSAFVFDAGATGRPSAYLTEPKFASFPNATMGWDNAKLQSWGRYYISTYGAWWEESDPEGAYGANIPMWGEAQKDETYGIKTTLKYLTGVVRISLENVPGNATAVRVVGWKNIAGTTPIAMAGPFKAVYATDDEINEDATLEPLGTPITVTKYGDFSGTHQNWIEYDLTGAAKAETFIFVPVIAQKYGLLQFQYTSDYGTTWKKIDEKQNVTVKRATWYAISMDEPFKVAGDTPSAITTVLEQLKEKSEITVETANATNVSATDDEITIPETSADVTLKLANLVNSGSGILYINSVDDAYAGTLTLDVTGTPSITNIMINLPEANVVVKGANLTAVDLGKDGTSPDNEAEGMAAKCLVIDGKVQSIYANAELGFGNAGADLKILKGAQVNKIEFETNYQADEIEINGTLTNALDMTAWQDLDGHNIKNVKIKVGNGATVPDLTTTGDVTVTGGTVASITTDGNVAISGTAATGVTAGKVTGDVAALSAYTTATKNSIALSGEAQIGGDITGNTKHTWTLEVKDKASVGGTANVDELTINGTSASVATVTVAGNATINDTEEAEAIKTKLTMTAGNTLNLNGGYIKELEVNAATKKALTIQHGTTAAYTAIALKSGSGLIKVSGTSVWNGKKVGDGTKVADKATIIAAYATGISDLYTATQLASYTGAVNGKLFANVDLNNQQWNGISLAGGKTFEGGDMDGLADKAQYPTIENLYIYANDKSTAVAGAGLFAKTTGSGANTIQNFTLKNVTSGINGAKGVSEFGALVGSAVTALTIKNVTVETATIGTTKVEKVGGLVGNTTAAITLNKVTVKALTLNGESQIGGVVGVSSNSVSVADNSSIAVAAINVPAEHQSTPDITKVAAKETKYGAVGMIAGQAAAKVSVATGKTLTVNDLITGNRQKMGYTWYYENPGPGLRYYHGLNGDKNKTIKDWVWVGLRSDITTTTEVDNAATFESSYGITEKALMVKHDIYTSCDK